MKKSTVTIVVLAFALVVSNAYWIYNYMDVSVGYPYSVDSYNTARGVAKQALAVIPVAASPGANRENIVAAARSADRFESEPFEKEGYLWVGDIGLRFDEADRLVNAVPAVEPF